MQTLITLFALQLTLMLMLSLWLATIIKIILHAKQTCRNRSGMLTHTHALSTYPLHKVQNGADMLYRQLWSVTKLFVYGILCQQYTPGLMSEQVAIPILPTSL